MIVAHKNTIYQQSIVHHRELRKLHAAEKRDLPEVGIYRIATIDKVGTCGINDAFAYRSILSPPIVITGDDGSIKEICPQICVHSKVCLNDRGSNLTIDNKWNESRKNCG